MSPSNNLADLGWAGGGGGHVRHGPVAQALRPRMTRLVRSVMGSGHAEADDILQQAMIAVTQALPAFRADSSVWHYCSRIVARTALAAGAPHGRGANASGRRRRAGFASEPHRRGHRGVGRPAAPLRRPAVARHAPRGTSRDAGASRGVGLYPSGEVAGSLTGSPRQHSAEAASGSRRKP